MNNFVSTLNIQRTRALPTYHCPGFEEELEPDFDEIEVIQIDPDFGEFLVQINDHRVLWSGGHA